MESVLPESKLHQMKYDKAVRRGRHPVTFPRKSELWTLCNNSSRRVDQMSKGRKLWNVVEDDTMKFYNHDDDDGDNKSIGSHGTVSTMGNGSINHGNTQSSPAKVMSVNFKLPPSVNSVVNNGINVDSQMNIIKINGFPIDLDAQVPITLGKKIVIMNYMGEFLCVDKNDVVKVKHRKAIELNDKICFRIINLNGYDDTRPILYGNLANLWLQIVEKNSDKNDYLWTYGYVLGSKAFESPLMQNLDNNIVNQTKPEKKDDKIVQTASMGAIASKAQLAKKLGVSLRGRRQALMKGAKIMVKKGKGVENIHDKEEGEGSSSEDEKVTNSSNNNHDGPKVCGGLVPIRIVETIKSEAHDLDSLDSGGQVKERASKFFSQKSFNFGKFLVYSGLRDDSTIAVNSVVKSQQPIYLVQDLYCISSSTGTNYAPWPLHADDFDVPVLDASSGSRPNTAQAIASLKLKHKSDHGKEPVSIVNSIQGAFGVEQTSNHLNDDDDEDMFAFTDVSITKKSTYPTSYGCIRKIEKKGPPFEHVLDRRCIWKFCVIDIPEQQTTSTQMTTRDKEAIECMNNALKKLKVSDKKRKGGRQYTGAKYQLPDDVKLPSGDRFPIALRSTVSSNVLLSEAKHFSPTRSKERIIKDFYATKMIQDGDSIYEKKGRKRKSKKYLTDGDTVPGTNANDDDAYTINSDGANSNNSMTPGSLSKNKLKLDPIVTSPVKAVTRYRQIPLCNENKTSGEIIKAIHDVLGYVSAKVDHKLYNEELGKKVDKPDILKKVEIDEGIIQERINKLEESDSFLLQCASYKDRLSSIQKIAAVSMAFKK